MTAKRESNPTWYGERLRCASTIFLELGLILEGSVEDGITDFRSLTYSLADEETAKQKTAAEAMKHAMGRANAALESKGQRVDALRFANPDDGCRRYECLFHAGI
jgi:hypothetical protein